MDASCLPAILLGESFSFIFYHPGEIWTSTWSPCSQHSQPGVSKSPVANEGKGHRGSKASMYT